MLKLEERKGKGEVLSEFCGKIKKKLNWTIPSPIGAATLTKITESTAVAVVEGQARRLSAWSLPGRHPVVVNRQSGVRFIHLLHVKAASWSSGIKFSNQPCWCHFLSPCHVASAITLWLSLSTLWSQKWHYLQFRTENVPSHLII